MPEDIIKGRIIFEGGGMTGGVAGAINKGTSASMSGTITSKRGLMDAITLPITDVLGGILKGVKKLGQWSPMLNAEFVRMRKGLQLILMPIGDTIANWLRPMAQSFIEHASVYYEEYKNGGLVSALSSALSDVWNAIFPTNPDGTISFEGIIENINDLTEISAILMLSGVAIAGGMALGSLIMAGISGMTLTTAGALAVTAILLFAAAELTDGGMEQLIASMAAAGVGYGIYSGNPYVAVASALIFTYAVWGDEMSSHLHNLFQGVKDKWESWKNENLPTEAGISPTGATGGVRDWMFGREAGVHTEVITNEDGENVLTFIENIEAIEPAWGGVFVKLRDGLNWIVDAFQTGHSPAMWDLFPMLGVKIIESWETAIKPTFDSMNDGINNTTQQVIALHQQVVSLPNITRTITYRIRYVRDD